MFPQALFLSSIPPPSSMAPKTLAFFFSKAKTAEEKTQSDESMRDSSNTSRENKAGEAAGEGSVCTPAKSGLETSSITRYCLCRRLA